MSRVWNRNTIVLAAMTLAAGLCAGTTVPGAAQEQDRPAARDVPSRKVIRTQRLRVPAKQDAVSFKRARVDAGGTIRADGHNLDLYGAVLIRRDRICASPEGARWTCGQRAFMAMRQLVEGQPISCSFRQAAGAPKAVCWVGDNDVTESLLSQGWAELAEGVTEESYVEALASARRSKAGIWGDGPP
jgi:endonuclease YncB( thermonuclease family)